jgi:Na+-driven multidrug efflux pump
MMRGAAGTAASFPLIGLLATFGSTVVAAYEAARRVRNLMNASGHGFNAAAGSLVGQELDKENETSATGYGNDLVVFSTVVYSAFAVFVVLFAPQIAALLMNEPGTVVQVVPFVRVAAVSVVRFGLNMTLSGTLETAADNNWTMYG